MAIVLRHCAICREAVQLAALDKVAGEAGTVTLTAHGMPAVKCAKGHASPVHRDFLLWFMAQLREKLAGLPAGEEKGLVFKKHFCACGKELPAKSGTRQTFAFEFAYEGAPGFKVELEAPVYPCPGCGKTQLHSTGEVRKALSHAMVGICDRAGFPHSG